MLTEHLNRGRYRDTLCGPCPHLGILNRSLKHGVVVGTPAGRTRVRSNRPLHTGGGAMSGREC